MVFKRKDVKVCCVGFLMVLFALMVIMPNQVLAQGATLKKIKIGVIGPMKFTLGEHTWYGSQLAAEEINAAGGVRISGVKHEIELIRADTNEFQSIPDAVSTFERVITVDKVNFLVGGFRTEACLAGQEVMADHKVIWINGGGPAHPELTARIAKNYDRYKYFFRAYANAKYSSKAFIAIAVSVGNKIREELKIATPRVALLMEKAKWVDPIIEASQNLFPKMGMEVAGVWRVSPMATDATAELTAIKASGAHVIFDILTGPVGVTIGKQWGELKIPAALVGLNSEGQSKRYWETTGKMCNYEATFHIFGRVNLSDKTVPFFDKFTARFQDWPLQTATNYDAVYVIKEAIERAGTLQADPVIAEIEKTNTKGILGQMIFHPKKAWAEEPSHAHEAIWGPGGITYVGLQWQDGRLRGIWPDGRPVLGDNKWVGLRYGDTVDYKIPPWMKK